MFESEILPATITVIDPILGFDVPKLQLGYEAHRRAPD